MEGEERQIVSAKRCTGTVVEWHGEWGWIEPNVQVDHHLASTNDGKIFLSPEDVQEEIPGVGGSVSFLVYDGGDLLGAADVRPAIVPKKGKGASKGEKGAKGAKGAKGGKANEHSYGSPAAAPAYRPAAATGSSTCPRPVANKGAFGAKGAGGKGKDDFFGKGAKGKGFGAAGKGAPRVKGYDGFAGKGAGYAAGKAKGGYGMQPQPVAAAFPGRMPVVNAHAAQQRIADTLYKSLWTATEAIKEMEVEWDHVTLAKRIGKYIGKAATAELFSMPYPEATKTFIENALSGYSAACGDRPWFYELDLSMVLAEAVWEIAKDCQVGPRANYPELQRVVALQYEDYMDGILLEKAMYDATKASFEDETLCAKVYKALGKEHAAAFNTAMADKRKLGELERVEVFLREWMEKTMNRLWQALANSEEVLSSDAVANLFQHLTAPFGDDHEFSCIPATLTPELGRPPSEWPLIMEAAISAHTTWFAQPEGGPKPAKKRKKAGAGIGPAAVAGSEEFDFGAFGDEDPLLLAAYGQADVAAGGELA